MEVKGKTSEFQGWGLELAGSISLSTWGHPVTTPISSRGGFEGEESPVRTLHVLSNRNISGFRVQLGHNYPPGTWGFNRLLRATGAPNLYVQHSFYGKIHFEYQETDIHSNFWNRAHS